jgi:hypothetical protein
LRRLPLALLLLLALAVPSHAAAPVAAVPRAHCDSRSLPETGLQGQVPLADRESGRSRRGYRCNLQLLGQAQGWGSSYVSPSTGHCAYLSQVMTAALSRHPGVQVVDARDPSHPRITAHLTSPAMAGDTWESLKTNERRHLLGGVLVGPIEGPAFFDLYDTRDCAHPRLLNSVSTTQLSLPADAIGHEGGFSPDGMTYWSTGGAPGVVTAIDVSDPHRPRVLFAGFMGVVNHGFSLSEDGRTLYLATIQPHGLTVMDVSGIQTRALDRLPRKIGSVTFPDGANGQHSIPVTWQGRPFLVYVDEQQQGGVRILDLRDLTHPRQVAHLQLEIQLPSAAGARAQDSSLSPQQLFHYDAHYCAVDRPRDPTRLACAEFNSGVRVFDVRDPLHAREVAYVNPPARTGQQAQLTGSGHAQGGTSGEPGGLLADLTADWCSSPPRFVGRDQLWVSCQDNGFMAFRFTT